MTKRTRFLGLSTIPPLTRSLMVGVVVLTAACSKDGPTEPTVVTGGKDTTTVVHPEPAVTAIQLQNNSQYTLVDVFIKPCSADSWGDDRYAGALAPGQSETFSDLSAGCYDVAVVTSDLLHGARIPNNTVTEGSTTVVTVFN